MKKLIARFDHRMLAFLLMLAAALAAVAGLSNLIGLPQAQLVHEEAGVLGPIGITFRQAMRPASVESRWRSTPDMQGRFQWEGQTLWFWPSSALTPGTTAYFELLSGAESLDGQVITRATRWNVKIRPSALLYLSPSMPGGEIWRVVLDGSPPRPLTASGGKVVDFSAGIDGRQIIYTVENDQKGSDLWRIDRDGSAARAVLACGSDVCSQPALSVDGKTAAYSRRMTTAAPGTSFSPIPRIWTLDLASGSTAPLFKDTILWGEAPSWSPDGSRLAFFDAAGHQIHILELATGKDILLHSQAGVVGGWTPDGRQLWYGDLVSSDTLPYGSAFRVDLLTNQSEALFTQQADPQDFGAPAPSPNGEWVVVSVRLHGGSRSTQLQLMRPDGSEQIAITDNYLFSHGAYHWDARGEQVVYQRFQIGSSSARPEIWLWNLAERSAYRIAVDGSAPAWLP